MSTIKKIVVTGPESTGKSQMSAYLAAYFNTVFVPEFARQYLENQNGKYVQEDLLKIAKGQITSENKFIQQANKILICDTDAIVLKIWSEVKYGNCNQEILQLIKQQQYDFYLLMDIDLPWEYDALREAPDLQQRRYLMQLYQQELEKSKMPFAIIKGKNDERKKNAILQLNQYLKLHATK